MKNKVLLTLILLLFTTSAFGAVDSLVYNPTYNILHYGWSSRYGGCGDSIWEYIDDAGASSCGDTCYVLQAASTTNFYIWGTNHFRPSPSTLPIDSVWVYWWLEAVTANVTLAVGRAYNNSGSFVWADCDTFTVTTTPKYYIMRYTSDPITGCAFDTSCADKPTGWGLFAVLITGKSVSAKFSCAKIVAYYNKGNRRNALIKKILKKDRE